MVARFAGNFFWQVRFEGNPLDDDEATTQVPSALCPLPSALFCGHWPSRDRAPSCRSSLSLCAHPNLPPAFGPAMT